MSISLLEISPESGGDIFNATRTKCNMSDNESSIATTMPAVRTAWLTGKPVRRDFGAVITELNSAKLVGEGSVFERGPHVPVTHLNYFKPPDDAFLSELKLKDRRSAKEWEYVNAAGVWLDMGLSAMLVAK